MRRAAAIALALALLLPSSGGHTQELLLDEEVLPDGYQATEEETEAWAEVQQENFIRARELAEKILEKDKKSYVARLVLGMVQHLAESNLPRALFHLETAEALYDERHGEKNEERGRLATWRWHAHLLRELADTHGAMEHHARKLDYIAAYNKFYSPTMIAERAWPLMKLGNFTEARLAAEQGLLAEDRPAQRGLALNALCAIEFEAGNDGQSYGACQRAVQDSEERSGRVSAVDLTNLAEASRSLFKLDEAERLNLQATLAPASWYGNPWLELAELYTRQGRLGEAVAALRKIPEYRAERPPHVRDADRNELRRAVSAFLLVIGKSEEALQMTGRALAAPDRRAHTSRDSTQDRTVLALLDRRAHRVDAQLQLERAASEPWYLRPLGFMQALYQELVGSRSGSLVQRVLDDEKRLVGSFRIGSSSAAIMPPWLVGELSEVLGTGVVSEALNRARAQDARSEAKAYYDAIEAEVRWRNDDYESALSLAKRALSSLPRGEVLLQARTMAIGADSARALARQADARGYYDAAFQRDPGAFRRLEIPVAVRAEARGALAQEVASQLLRSPRFTAAPDGLRLSIEADAASGRVCLSGDAGQVISCSELQANSEDGADGFAGRLTQQALQELFAPRIDLTQMDINSLDGTNLSTRNALQDLFE